MQRNIRERVKLTFAKPAIIITFNMYLLSSYPAYINWLIHVTACTDTATQCTCVSLYRHCYPVYMCQLVPTLLPSVHVSACTDTVTQCTCVSLYQHCYLVSNSWKVLSFAEVSFPDLTLSHAGLGLLNAALQLLPLLIILINYYLLRAIIQIYITWLWK